MRRVTWGGYTYPIKHQAENVGVKVVESMNVGGDGLCAAVGHLDCLHRLIEHIHSWHQCRYDIPIDTILQDYLSHPVSEEQPSFSPSGIFGVPNHPPLISVT